MEDVLRQRIAQLEEQVEQLTAENRFLATEAEHELHGRIISEKLELEQSEERIISAAVESIVTYNRLLFAVYFQVKNECLETAAYYSLSNNIDFRGGTYPFSEELKNKIGQMDGYIDLCGEERQKVPFLPSGETFSDGYLLPVNIDEKMYGLVFVANNNSNATQYQNHLNAIITPVSILEKRLVQYLFTASLEETIAQRTHSLEEDIKKREAIEKELASERDLFIDGPVFIIRWQNVTGWPVEYVSKNVDKVLGYSVDDFTSSGGQYSSFIHSDDVERFRGELDTAAEEKNTHFRHLPYRVVRKDGSVIWLEHHTLLQYKDDGTVTHYLGYVSDITEFEETKNSLLLSQQRQQLHFDQSPLGIIEWDTDFKVVSWNVSAERIFGYSSEEAIGRHAVDLVLTEEVREHVGQIWQQLMKNVGGTRSDNLNITKNGVIIECEWYNTTLINDHGEVVGVASMVNDVTEAREIERVLKKNEKKYLSALETTSEGFWLIDPKNHKTREVNSSLCDILGYSPEEIIGRTPLEFVDADNLKILTSRLPKIQANTRLSFEISLLTKHGENVPCFFHGTTVRNDDGSPRYAVA